MCTGSLANSTATPRIKTKLFACQCLLKIIDAVGSSPEHFDLIKAIDAGGDGWLVINLEVSFPSMFLGVMLV